MRTLIIQQILQQGVPPLRNTVCEKPLLSAYFESITQEFCLVSLSFVSEERWKNDFLSLPVPTTAIISQL